MIRKQQTIKHLLRTSTGATQNPIASTASAPKCEFDVFVHDDLNVVRYRKCGAPATYILKATRTTTRHLCAQHARRYISRRPQDIAPIR